MTSAWVTEVGNAPFRHKVCHFAECALGKRGFIRPGRSAKCNRRGSDPAILKRAFFRRATLKISHASCLLFAAQPFCLSRKEVFLGRSDRNRRRHWPIGFKLGQLQVHTDLFQLAITRRQFVLKQLLGCLGRSLQGRDLSC